MTIKNIKTTDISRIQALKTSEKHSTFEFKANIRRASKACNCVMCEVGGKPSKHDKGQMFMVAIPSNNNVGVGLCAVHMNNVLYKYTDENTNHVGKNVKAYDNISFSFELESLGFDKTVLAMLCKLKFLPTRDITVHREMKAPISNNFNSIAEAINFIDYANKSDNYDFSVTNDACGCHTHFGLQDNSFNFMALSFDYKKLFKPLNDYVVSLGADKQIEFLDVL